VLRIGDIGCGLTVKSDRPAHEGVRNVGFVLASLTVPPGETRAEFWPPAKPGYLCHMIKLVLKACLCTHLDQRFFQTLAMTERDRRGLGQVTSSRSGQHGDEAIPVELGAEEGFELWSVGGPALAPRLRVAMMPPATAQRTASSVGRPSESAVQPLSLGRRSRSAPPRRPRRPLRTCGPLAIAPDLLSPLHGWHSSKRRVLPAWPHEADRDAGVTPASRAGDAGLFKVGRERWVDTGDIDD
jgi:hypothetical protein